jgi:hypothetical protein
MDPTGRDRIFQLRMTNSENRMLAEFAGLTASRFG